MIRDFRHEVQYKRRAIFSKNTQKFLNCIADDLAYRKTLKPTGTALYRSQIGLCEDNDEDGFIYDGFDEDRMKPLRYVAFEGRANPKGIPVMYLSDDSITSMSELRPQIGQVISCAKFLTTRELKFVDCCTSEKKYNEAQICLMVPKSQEEWRDYLWFQIGQMFSQPIINEGNFAPYVPTQIISEIFKNENYDGFYFKSHLGPGINFVLFESSDVNMVESDLRVVKKVDYSFEDFDPQKHT